MWECKGLGQPRGRGNRSAELGELLSCFFWEVIWRKFDPRISHQKLVDGSNRLFCFGLRGGGSREAKGIGAQNLGALSLVLV